MKHPHFLLVDTNSQKLKVGRKFFGLAWSKMGVVNLDFRTLKLTVSEEWRDGINWIFCMHLFFASSYKLKGAWKSFGKGLVKYRCGQSGDGTLKLIVSEEWTLFFACWYRFTKINSWSKVWSWDSKINCILKMNWWNKLIFSMLVKIQ